MASNSKKPKSDSRKKTSEEAALGVHSIPREVVEIERNIIENWLLSLKHWFRDNTAVARKIILGIAAVAILVLLGVFIHGAVIEKQNSDFFNAMLSFESARKYKAEKPRYEKKLNDLVKNTDKLCNARWSTQYSNAGCLLSAVFYNELAKPSETSASLNKFADHASNEAIASYAAMISAFYSEKINKPEDALKVFEELDRNLEKSAVRDIVLFHKGRLQYYANKHSEAKKTFREILDNHKNSSYTEKSRDYLMLIQLSSAESK